MEKLRRSNAPKQIPVPEAETLFPWNHRIEQIKRNLGKFRYNGYSKKHILGAVEIARSHQQNEITDNRTRRFDGVPYIDHPLAMVEEAIRMRLHPTGVMACAMHDVPEDVKIGNLNSPEDWITYIEQRFKNYDDKERLLRILRSELKSESFDKLPDKHEVTSYYMNTSLGRKALAYLTELRGGDPHITRADREQIAAVLYDLNRVFNDSFVKQSGQEERRFDPLLLIVKILDTWQNLQTPAFWRTQLDKQGKDAKTVAKLLRARVLTNVAEFLGMRNVASDMTMSLAAIQELGDLDVPVLRKAVEGQIGASEIIQKRLDRMRDILAYAAEISPNISAQTRTSRHHQKRRLIPSYQMPWDEDGDSIKGPRIVWHIPSSAERTYIKPALQLNPEARVLVEAKTRQTQHHGMRASFQTEIGRWTEDHNVYDVAYAADDDPIGVVRIEKTGDHCPRFISTAKAPEHKPADPAHVPEQNIFHPAVCTYMEPLSRSSAIPDSLQLIDTKLLGLVDFMLSPRAFMENGEGQENTPNVMVANGMVLLATNRTDVTVWEISQKRGIAKPVVRPIKGKIEYTQPVEAGDPHVLDRMRAEGRLDRYHVVIIEESVSENEPIYMRLPEPTL